MDTSEITPPVWLMMGGGVLAVIGSFMAWASVGGVSISGMDADDGPITLGLGIAAAVLGFLSMRVEQKWPQILALVAGALIVLVAIIDVLDVMDNDFTVGIGLWIVLVGGIGATAGGVMSLKKS